MTLLARLGNLCEFNVEACRIAFGRYGHNGVRALPRVAPHREHRVNVYKMQQDSEKGYEEWPRTAIKQ